MIEVLIDNLINSPTPDTASIYMALNTPDMLAELGLDDGNGRRVHIFDGRNSNPDTPYVEMWDTEKRQPIEEGLGMGSSLNSLYHLMAIRYVSAGETPKQAKARANYMKMAVEGAITQIKGGITSGVLIRWDKGLTQSYDKITGFVFDNSGSQPAKMTNDPGLAISQQERLRVAEALTILKVAVSHNRTGAAR